MGPLTLRPFQPQDGEACERILAAIWPEDEKGRAWYRFGLAQVEPRFALTLVAEQEGQVVGFAGVWQSALHFHPDKYHGHVSVAPEHQRLGVGSVLYTAMLDRLAGRGAWRLRGLMNADCSGARRFFGKRGFGELQRTYITELDVGDLDGAALDGDARWPHDHGYEVRSWAELAGQAGRADEAAALLRELYGDVHLYDPPADVPPSTWRKILFGDDLLPEALFFALRGGRLVAMSGLAKTDVAVDVLWSGTLRAHRRHELPLTLALTARALAWAKGLGLGRAELEADSVDPSRLTLMRHFSFESGSEWVTLVKELREGS